jgi:epimerase transport system membrane fusion protein
VAKITPADVDVMRVGQRADIRFSAFNVRDTHVVEGELVNVSADVLEDPATRASYYQVEIAVTPDGVAQLRADGMDLLPGMPAEAMIKTGGRTLLNYLLKPLLDIFARAFREE